MEQLYSYCARRAIRCAILDDQGRVLSTGRNGPAFGQCQCPGKDVLPGTGAHVLCYGLHAEQRAIVGAGLGIAEAFELVSDKAPCESCVKLLLGTPIRSISFKVSSNETANAELWMNAGRMWTHKPKLVVP